MRGFKPVSCWDHSCVIKTQSFHEIKLACRKDTFYAAHKPGCSSSSNLNLLTKEEINDVVEVQKVKFKDNELNLIFDYHPTSLPKRQPTVIADENEEGQLSRSRHVSITHTKDPTHERIATWKLSRIMNILLYPPHYLLNATFMLNVNGFTRKPSQIFVHFEDAIVDKTASGKSRPNIYWGTLSRMDDKFTYLNTASSNKIGINIEYYREQLLDRYKIKGAFDVCGKPCLICKRSAIAPIDPRIRLHV